MALDLEVELEAAQTAYLANADWQSSNSVAMARAFVAACTKLLLLVPTMSKQAGRFEVQFDTGVLAARLKVAESFVASQSSGKAVSYSFENSR